MPTNALLDTLAAWRDRAEKAEKELKDAREALKDIRSIIISCTELHQAKNIADTALKGDK
jgi:hypothetical protein